MNCFTLALIQMKNNGKVIVNERTGKLEYDKIELLNTMIRIRKWIDKHGANTAEKIMQGQTIYQYNNKMKVYANV